MEVWPRVASLIATEGACALVSVMATRGSVPRGAGARMIVRPDGAFFGTIGGGTLEWQALAKAQALLERRDAAALVLDQPLGPALGQCCGGHVTLAIERFGAGDLDAVTRLAAAERKGPFRTRATLRGGGFVREVIEGETAAAGQAPSFVEQFGEVLPVVALFGAGHVGKALVLALAPLPFRVVWHDGRPGAFPAAVPANASLRSGPPEAVLAAVPDGAQILVMTHSHALDLAVVTAALSAGRFAHVGLIGSATKRARFLRQLGAVGLGEVAATGLRCPIGLPGLAGKQPAVIAASVAAECLILAQSRTINAEPAHRRHSA
ncbi:xanthine dehydrogenase accessory protein XdhC [Phreatobacter cathodiphilus]|uniref:Xanthine dehydrogenase accessory protein XdhC n=1 Tax=Phreatobacter cathodiphilus TaxID=1868589 RepID=A0A2S0N9Y3_9HYPH|nr:xanthine dehydrogenase accessory protein XdhC [Phreatobacter cathodiphilus]AVO44952.1 xanthine dehydrogenase accessory protein XdhC [Phreatobacter cathodiphilus]